jgi:hypothetical protein
MTFATKLAAVLSTTEGAARVLMNRIEENQIVSVIEVVEVIYR